MSNRSRSAAQSASDSKKAPESEAATPLERFAEIVGDDSAGWAVGIHRKVIDQGVKRLKYCGKIPFDDFSLDALQDAYGGGDYELQLKDLKHIVRKREFVLVDGEPKARVDTPPIAELPAAAAAPTSDLMSVLLKGLATGIAAALPVLATKMFEPRPSDPVLTALLPALVKGRGGEGMSPTEFQAAIDAARALEFNRGVEFGALKAAVENGGGSDGDDGWIKTAIDAGLQLLDRAVENDRAKAGAPVRALPAGAPPVQPPAEKTSGTLPMWAARVKPYTSYMLQWAHSGTDAVRQAELVVRNLLPVSIVEQLAEAATSETFVADAMAAFPDFRAPDVEPWFRKFFGALEELLTVEADAPDDGAQSEEAANAQQA